MERLNRSTFLQTFPIDESGDSDDSVIEGVPHTEILLNSEDGENVFFVRDSNTGKAM